MVTAQAPSSVAAVDVLGASGPAAVVALAVVTLAAVVGARRGLLRGLLPPIAAVALGAAAATAFGALLPPRPSAPAVAAAAGGVVAVWLTASVTLTRLARRLRAVTTPGAGPRPGVVVDRVVGSLAAALVAAVAAAAIFGPARIGAAAPAGSASWPTLLATERPLRSMADALTRLTAPYRTLYDLLRQSAGGEATVSPGPVTYPTAHAVPGTRPRSAPLAPGTVRPGAAITSAVRAAARSVVRITGDAPACSQLQEGSGFVVAPHSVLTNAHVVQGLTAPRVQVDGAGPRYRAHVVYDAPGIDLAVLDVPGLPAPPLRLAPALLRTGTPVTAAGFPLDGPLRLTAGTVTGAQEVTGPSVGRAAAEPRPAYVLAITVRPGNSGGPLLAPDGTVAGVVFATGTAGPPTGYAITAAQAIALVHAADGAVTPVDTGTCTRR
jgi:hypothetical protein